MRSMLIVICLVFAVATANAQTTYRKLDFYCVAITVASEPLLQYRIKGMPRSGAQELLKPKAGEDPDVIRWLEEVIEFAYSRPSSMNLEQMKSELRSLCLAKKIFVQ